MTKHFQESGMHPVLNRRKPLSTEELAEQVSTVSKSQVEKPKKVDISKVQVVSTGSTLLDLAISGTKRREGGIPGGIIIEIYGPAGAGKTALLAEICASAQVRGGQVRFLDPEARLDQEYSRIYGLELQKDDYHRPDTVKEMFNDYIWPWKPKSDKVINVVGADSLAALSTVMEMEDEDKRGQKRAKDFSEGLRKTCRLIANSNWLLVCTNQVREGDGGEVTPGGKAIPFYSSLRIRVGPLYQNWKIEKRIKLDSDKEVKKIIGIKSLCYVKKSTIDDPYREAVISIVFGRGIDTVRDELQYVKDMTGDTKYNAIGGGFMSMDKAIECVEEGQHEERLRENAINLWHEIQDKFKSNRSPKVRR